MRVLGPLGSAEVLSPLFVSDWSIQGLGIRVVGVSCERRALLFGRFDCFSAYFEAGTELIFALVWYF